MEAEHLTSGDELACITLDKQAEEFALRQTRSVHGVEFREFAPVCVMNEILIIEIYIFSMMGHVSQICMHN
jgi:hypothetical protein